MLYTNTSSFCRHYTRTLIIYHFLFDLLAMSNLDLSLLECHHGHEDALFSEIFTIDDRSETFSYCHPMDIVCKGMQDERFQPDFFAGTLRTFFGQGRALLKINTACIEAFEYYLIACYWGGNNAVITFCHTTVANLTRLIKV